MRQDMTNISLAIFIIFVQNYNFYKESKNVYV